MSVKPRAFVPNSAKTNPFPRDTSDVLSSIAGGAAGGSDLRMIEQRQVADVLGSHQNFLQH